MNKVGQVLYWCGINCEDGTAAIEEYHVRTIRGGYVHAIWKNKFTWGKRSKAHGDYGWLKNIPAWCRERWKTDPPDYLKTTKLAAIRHEIKTIRPGDFLSEAIYEKAMRTLKSMETRARK